MKKSIFLPFSVVLFLVASASSEASGKKTFRDEQPPMSLTQGGPGVLGTLVPVHKPSSLHLLFESTKIYLFENSILVEGDFNISNPTKNTLTEQVGVPSLYIKNRNRFALAPAFKNQNQDVLHHETIDEPVDIKDFNYLPYIRFGQQFELTRRWYAITLNIPPGETRRIFVRVKMDYLQKREELNSRREESAKLFRYIRSYGARWGGPIRNATVTLHPKLKQEAMLKIEPTSLFKSRSGVPYYWVEKNNRPSKNQDITIRYDPIVFTVLQNGPNNELFDNDPSTEWCFNREENNRKSFEIMWGKHRQLDSITFLPGQPSPTKTRDPRTKTKNVKMTVGKPGWYSEPIQTTLDNKPTRQTTPIEIREEATLLYLQFLNLSRGETTCLAEVDIKFRGND